MSNSGIAFDTSLLQAPGEANASLAGVPFRINPKSVSLPYSLKINQTQTLGGMVIQIFGVTWGDLTVQGEFGASGWQSQRNFFSLIQSLVQNTANAQIRQVFPDQSLINPSGSVRFLFPLLNYDFMVFIKGYSSVEGQSIELYNENINPTWTLTFTIDNDNSNLTKVATDNYITRLAQGLGYDTNAGFNGPVNNSNPGNNLQGYLQQYASGQSLLQQFTQAYGATPSSSSSTVSGTASLVGNTNAQQCFNYMTSLGYTPTQAAAFVGNWIVESGCSPIAVEGAGVSANGQGLVQWSYAERWVTCCQVSKTPYVEANQPGAPSLAQQLAFVAYELSGPYLNVANSVKATSDIGTATSIIMNQYEVAGTATLPQRTQSAQQALSTYS